MSRPDPELLDRVRARLVQRGVDASPVEVAAALRAEDRLVGDRAVLDVLDALRRDMLGAGPLEDLLRTPGVTDVLVNGPTEVYADFGDGLVRTDAEFGDEAAVRRLGQRLAAAAGRRLDDASPYVDVRLPDGTRLHAVLAPVALPGTCLSLRVPARAAMTLAELGARGLVDPAGDRLLRTLVQSKVAFLVSGGTGTGKTTLLAALLSLADRDERLVIVEEASELRPEHPHVVWLEARQPNVEGMGGIGTRDLVRQALRMRPDRLVVGEVRGGEVVDLLGALNTGHRGGCGTVHANSARDVPARLEALGSAAALGRAALHSQLSAALSVVVHLSRGQDGRRRLAEMAVLVRGDHGLVDAVPALRFPPHGRPVQDGGAARLHELLAGDP